MDFENIRHDLVNGNTTTLKEFLEKSDLSFDKHTYFELVNEAVRLHEQTKCRLLKVFLLGLEPTKDGIRMRYLNYQLYKAFKQHNVELIEKMIPLCVKVSDFGNKYFDKKFYEQKIEIMKYDDALSEEERLMKKKLIRKSANCVKKNNLQGAIAHAQRLIEIEGPVDAVAEVKLVKSYYALGEYDKAMKFCRLGLEKCDLLMFHRFIAKIYKDTGKYTDAINECEKIVKINDYHVIYILAADCYLELGDINSAFAVLERARSIYLEHEDKQIEFIDEKIKQIKESNEIVDSDIISDEIIECARVGNITKITEILDLLDINDKQRMLIDINVARLLYSNKFFNKGDTLLKRVEQSKDKTKLIKRNLEEAKVMKKVYKNR